jgi:hypothetical protein
MSIAACTHRDMVPHQEFDMASRYGTKAGDKVRTAMHELERGTLRSGSGRQVTSRAQAVAIGLNEARKAGGKVPKSGR